MRQTAKKSRKNEIIYLSSATPTENSSEEGISSDYMINVDEIQVLPSPPSKRRRLSPSVATPSNGTPKLPVLSLQSQPPPPPTQKSFTAINYLKASSTVPVAIRSSPKSKSTSIIDIADSPSVGNTSQIGKSQ